MIENKEEFILKLTEYIHKWYDDPSVREHPDFLAKKSTCCKSIDYEEDIDIEDEDEFSQLDALFSVSEKKCEEKPLKKTKKNDVKKLESSTKLPDWLLKDTKPTFQQSLFKLIDEKKLKDVEVYKKAEIDKRLFSKIRADENYSPRKNTVIQLCFGLELTLEEALDLMITAGYTLSFSSKSDIVVRYFLENKNYDLIELNTMLYEFDLKPIFE